MHNPVSGGRFARIIDDLLDGIFIDIDTKRLPKLRLAEVQIHSFFVPVPQVVFFKVSWLTLVPF